MERQAWPGAARRGSGSRPLNKAWRADAVAHPVHAFRVQAVDGFVKKQVLRLADERTSKAQALLHA